MPPGISAGELDARMRPFLLLFHDAATEQRYKDFVYNTSGFWGGKMWFLLSNCFWLTFYIYFHGLVQGWTTDMFTDPHWVGVLVTLASIWLQGATLAVPALVPYREEALFLGLCTHSSVITIVVTFGMGSPFAYRLGYSFYAALYHSMLAQARFSRILLPNIIGPVLTLIVGTSMSSTYWDYASKLEIYFWVLLPIAPLAQWQFERENRRAFLRKEECEREMSQLEAKSSQTRTMIVNFFAHTPTRDFLADGKARLRQRDYQDVAMVVTDLAGFTSWTAVTDASTAAEHLAQMFDALDVASERFGVEKISTVGDCYQGAAFADDHTHEDPLGSGTSSRAWGMMQFGDAALHSFSMLQVRVGLHIGDVTAAFVGSSPPKFDLFGEAFEVTKVMESSGVPGHVHASRAILEAAAPLGGSAGEVQETELGMVFPRVAAKLNDADVEKERREADLSVSVPFTEREIHTICEGLMRLAGMKQRAKQQQLRRASTLSVESGTDSPQVLTPMMRAQKAQQQTQQLRLLPNVVVTGATLEQNSGEQSPPSSPHQQRYAPSSGAKLLPQGTSPRVVEPSTESVSQMSGSLVLSISGGGGSDFAEQQAILADDEAVALTWKLTFADPANEKLYQDFVRGSGIVKRANLVTLSFQALFVIAYLVLCCIDTTRNRLLVLHTVLIMNAYFIAEISGVPIPRWTAVTIGHYHLVPGLLAMTETPCTSTAAFYLSCCLFCLVMNAIMSINFMFQWPLLVRCVGICATCLFGFILTVIRRFAFDDHVAPFDVTWLLAIVMMSSMSLSVDITLRISFAADRKLRLSLRRVRGGFHRLAATAMDVMVPRFVSERLLGADGGPHKKVDLALDAADPDDANGQEDVDDTEMQEGGDALLARDRTVAQTWEFDKLSVMFVSFETAAESVSAQLEAANEVFSRLEMILSSYGVQKIKTIGTTLMCAHGMQQPSSGSNGSDSAFVQLQAAAQMVQRVLSHDPVSTYKIGIHVGPSFGAVMGRSSILFDVFGDSVNMASRMSSTAAPRSIQASEAVYTQCSHHSVLRFEKNLDVAVKGKGKVTTYKLLV